MKVLVTGATGQLGQELMRVGSTLMMEGNFSLSVYGLSRQQLNVTNEACIRSVLSNLHPDIIIHTGAYTKVDLAEQEPYQAYFANTYGTRNLAAAAAEIGAKVVYISTDYVFDGTKQGPYNEWDAVAPINVYGRSKWAGEEYVRWSGIRHFIIRTAWVYGAGSRNFVKTIVNLARTQMTENPDGHAVLSVVTDQIGCPTYSLDLAKSIWHLLLHAPTAYGTYHIVSIGSCSWYEFTETIFSVLGWQERISINPVTSAEFSRPAKRPANSALESIALPAQGLPVLPHWRDSLTEFLLYKSGLLP